MTPAAGGPLKQATPGFPTSRENDIFVPSSLVACPPRRRHEARHCSTYFRLRGPWRTREIWDQENATGSKSSQRRRDYIANNCSETFGVDVKSTSLRHCHDFTTQSSNLRSVIAAVMEIARSARVSIQSCLLRQALKMPCQSSSPSPHHPPLVLLASL